MSLISQQMATSFIVKNTFFDLIRQEEEAPVRRSSSVPRTFKPGMLGDSARCFAPSSNASTSADLDKDMSENGRDVCTDCPDSQSELTDDEYGFAGAELCQTCSPRDSAPTLETSKSKVTLSLSDMVAEKVTVKAKLRSQAKPFKSSRTPPAEVTEVLAKAVEVLKLAANTTDVQVRDGGMGGTTMIVAKSLCAEPDTPLIFSLVKDALLNSAEHSENTYILGYGAQPFNNLDQLSFSANIGCVPAAHQDTACWDMYEHGCCARHAAGACRWEHPAATDMMRIIVMVVNGA